MSLTIGFSSTSLAPSALAIQDLIQNSADLLSPAPIPSTSPSSNLAHSPLTVSHIENLIDDEPLFRARMGRVGMVSLYTAQVSGRSISRCAPRVNLHHARPHRDDASECARSKAA